MPPASASLPRTPSPSSRARLPPFAGEERGEGKEGSGEEKKGRRTEERKEKREGKEGSGRNREEKKKERKEKKRKEKEKEKKKKRKKKERKEKEKTLSDQIWVRVRNPLSLIDLYEPHLVLNRAQRFQIG